MRLNPIRPRTMSLSLSLLSLASSMPASAQSLEPPRAASVPDADGGVATLQVEPARRARFTHLLVGSLGCVLPCSLALDAGVYPLSSDRTQETVGTLVVGTPGSYQLVDRGSPHRIAGAILLLVGLAMAAGLWAIGLTCHEFDPACQIGHFAAWPVVGFAIAVTGVGLLGWSATSRLQLRRLESTPARSSVPLRFQLVGAGIAPLPSGGASLGIALSF